MLKFIERNWSLRPLTNRSRDNLPNPKMVKNNRNTTAYRIVSTPGRELFGWIDIARQFPLRIKTEDGSTITAENVRYEPQPAQLFEILPGFRKFDPLNLIQRIKPSDVWVAGENDRAR